MHDALTTLFPKLKEQGPLRLRSYSFNTHRIELSSVDGSEPMTPRYRK